MRKGLNIAHNFSDRHLRDNAPLLTGLIACNPPFLRGLGGSVHPDLGVPIAAGNLSSQTSTLPDLGTKKPRAMYVRLLADGTQLVACLAAAV